MVPNAIGLNPISQIGKSYFLGSVYRLAFRDQLDGHGGQGTKDLFEARVVCVKRGLKKAATLW